MLMLCTVLVGVGFNVKMLAAFVVLPTFYILAEEMAAKARRVLADAEAYATQVVAVAIAENGLEAAQYQVALKQVEALQKVASGQGNQTIVMPANALDAFADAFKMLKGRG